jgi:hypothetical protein
MGSGSAAPPAQVAFSATVTSPYGSTTVAVWSILVRSHGGVASNDGACVLSSTLLGPGGATAGLDLGGGEVVQPCSPQWWGGPISATHPDLGAAGIPQPGE